MKHAHNTSNSTLATMKTTTTTTTTAAATFMSTDRPAASNDTRNNNSSSDKYPKKSGKKKAKKSSRLLDFFLRVGEQRSSYYIAPTTKDKVVGGAYLVPSKHQTPAATIVRTTSYRTVDTRASTFADNENDSTCNTNDDDDYDEEAGAMTTITQPSIAWSPSDHPDFNKGAPVLARRPDGVKNDPRLADLDDQMLLSHIMFEARRLPKSPGPFASAHVLINADRTRRMAQPLLRCPAMDELARQQAQVMSQSHRLEHTQTPFELQQRVVSIVNNIENKKNMNDIDSDDDSVPAQHGQRPLSDPNRRIGENVYRGKTIKDMHTAMMKSQSHRNNILHRRFIYMGVGTAKGDDGLLYLCQIFSS